MSKPIENQPDPTPDVAIDRLVDGCLDDAERRVLLLKLEDEPDGWRRCALAFLEDQAWRAALGVPAAPNVLKAPAVVPRRRWPVMLRMSAAASVLAATFAAGFATGGAPRSGIEPATGWQAASKADPARSGIALPPIREVGYVDVVDASNGESPPGRVPILAGPGLDERWLREQPPSVPEYVRAQWERKGYQVDERRRLVSLDLEDGRRVEIPVDEVNVEFVGNRPL